MVKAQWRQMSSTRGTTLKPVWWFQTTWTIAQWFSKCVSEFFKRLNHSTNWNISLCQRCTPPSHHLASTRCEKPLAYRAGTSSRTNCQQNQMRNAMWNTQARKHSNFSQCLVAGGKVLITWRVGRRWAFWIFISKRLEAWVCHFSFHGNYSMGLSATLLYLENIIKHLQCLCLKDSSYDRFMQLNHEGTHLI